MRGRSDPCAQPAVPPVSLHHAVQPRVPPPHTLTYLPLLPLPPLTHVQAAHPAPPMPHARRWSRPRPAAARPLSPPALTSRTLTCPAATCGTAGCGRWRTRWHRVPAWLPSTWGTTTSRRRVRVCVVRRYQRAPPPSLSFPREKCTPLLLTNRPPALRRSRAAPVGGRVTVVPEVHGVVVVLGGWVGTGLCGAHVGCSSGCSNAGHYHPPPRAARR
jgi:hypothetical protein